jgi:PhnB protein
MSTTPSNLTIQPYLNFDGRCEEAIEFYKQALGAEVDMLMRFKENPEPPQPGCMTPGTEDKVMHASLRIGDTLVMASDGRCGGKTEFKGISLSLVAPTVEEAEKRFAALADGGEAQMPLTKTFFSPSFGMVADKFGVCWMILARGPGM